MPITERIKGTQEMKKLQAELTTTQTQKQERQAQMEPLQERVAEVLAQAEEAKAHIAQTQEECMELISDEIAVQIVDTLKEKTCRHRHRQQSSGKSSRRSPRRSKKRTKDRWLGMSHMSVLGACWRQAKGQSGKSWRFWERKHAREKRQLEEKQHTHMQGKATTGRKNNTHTWEEDLTTVGLGFW
jgi:hypothetical protein